MRNWNKLALAAMTAAAIMGSAAAAQAAEPGMSPAVQAKEETAMQGMT